MNWKERIYNYLHITSKTVVKVYHGFGDNDNILVLGHVLKRSPLPQVKYKKGFFNNTKALLRLFIVEPCAKMQVRCNWQGDLQTSVTDEKGFYKMEWSPATAPPPGMHEIKVTAISSRGKEIIGSGFVSVPHATQFVFVSDIDDTFLISHSANLRKRLYVLLTKNAQTRKPFDGVAEHYHLLSLGNTTKEKPNPFFYVSSSEWNLYDYIKEFCREHKMPEGVFLLNTLKELSEVLNTGQNNHSGKFQRIGRLLVEYPNRQFVLLGDDSQQDPYIYQKLAENAPENIFAVYIRHVNKENKEKAQKAIDDIHSLGIETCYFTHSSDAITHSRKVGLIDPEIISNLKKEKYETAN